MARRDEITIDREERDGLYELVRNHLGHHSAAFTLSRYTHLLPGDEAPALDLDPLLPAAAPESAAAFDQVLAS
jgi:hypothetical protein